MVGVLKAALAPLGLAVGKMAKLSQFQTNDKDFRLMQSSWATQLNPLLTNQSLQSSILKNVTLSVGSNVINHLLSRTLVGWRIIRQRGAASIYDTQDSNQTPQLTLTLVSDALVVVDLEVF